MARPRSGKTKKQVMITLDYHVYLHYNSKEGFNLSKFVNDVLSHSMHEEFENVDLLELERRLDELKDERLKIDDETVKVHATLARLQSDAEQAEKESLDKALFVDDTIRASNQLKDLF